MTGSRNPYQKNESGISRRALRGLLLTLLLPPVGLVYLWRGGVFRLRGRILVTALACIEMTILLSTGLFGLIQWDRRPATQTPVPGNAAAVTAYPGDDTVNALSNIDEIIAQNMSTQNPSAQETLDPDATPTPVPMDEEERQVILNTVVYSVHRGAQYYHRNKVCGNQSNGRELTVAEAIAEGLGACPNCDPPVPQ